MEWLSCIQKTIALLEEHLLDEDKSFDLAKEVGISPVYLQKGFSLMTGYSIAEYTRNRKLYLAALDILAGKEELIDIAFNYGYETYESFNKAFVRFHNVTPTRLRRDPSKFKVFLSLKIKIDIQGGNEMNFNLVKMPTFKLVGFAKVVSFEEAYTQIPKFWNEFMQKYGNYMDVNFKATTEIEKVISQCIVGRYGVCIDQNDSKSFKYVIAGEYKEGMIVPDGMEIIEIEPLTFAKFDCTGPLPGALQSVNTKIFKEWLPSNDKYEISKGINIEFYSNGDPSSVDYHSEIWLPVKEK